MAEKKIDVRILRDFWNAEGERIRAGSVVSVTAEDAIEMIEANAAESVKKK